VSKTWKGKLVREDLGSGAWVLDTGKSKLLLAGEVPAGLDGKQVVVEGTASDAMGFGMVGDGVIDVATVKRA
jgi:hypothetical protein